MENLKKGNSVDVGIRYYSDNLNTCFKWSLLQTIRYLVSEAAGHIWQKKTLSKKQT
jgi:hypothetical protein